MKFIGTSLLGTAAISLVLLLASAGAQAGELQTIENMPAHCDMYDWLREGNCPDGGRYDDGRQLWGGHVYVSGQAGGGDGPGAAGASGSSGGGGSGGGGSYYLVISLHRLQHMDVSG